MKWNEKRQWGETNDLFVFFTFLFCFFVIENLRLSFYIFQFKHIDFQSFFFSFLWRYMRLMNFETMRREKKVKITKGLGTILFVFLYLIWKIVCIFVNKIKFLLWYDINTCPIVQACAITFHSKSCMHGLNRTYVCHVKINWIEKMSSRKI